MATASDARSFDGETFIVTGTARGIGRAVARLLTARGATVVGGDVRDQTETATLCDSRSGGFVPVRTDVTDTAEVDALVERAVEAGGVDGVVNVAGIVRRGAFATYDDDDWDDSLDVNLSGPFRVIRAAVEQLTAAGGVVVNVSSIYGQIGAGGRVGYVATKAGMEGLTRALAAELGPDGVRVNAVAPGFISTPMTEPYLEREGAIERFRELTVTGRLGEPEDVAEVVAFLASDAARFVSGETVLVDGGRATVE
jgi:3-oxoacyl-[acyl-carrier protein] reductase